jgi:hypothetical protein
MATTLKLQSITPPYTFISLGYRPNGSYIFEESELFPIGSIVTLTSGKFPMTDYTNMYNHSRLTHVIGGRTVRITSFSDFCKEENLNENTPCEIDVVEDQDGGKRRRRLTKHRRSKRYRRRASRHRT